MDAGTFIYSLSALIVTICLLSIAYACRHEANVKNVVMSCIVAPIMILIPFFNTLIAAFAIVVAIKGVMEDDDPNMWYNRKLFPENKK